MKRPVYKTIRLIDKCACLSRRIQAECWSFFRFQNLTSRPTLTGFYTISENTLVKTLNID
jgi:hypothetical protein